MITGPSGISVISSSITSIKGLFLISFVTNSLNKSLSTASAPPAGTRVASAHLIIRESNILISCFNNPTAFSSPAALKLFEHTNSANNPVLCAGVNLKGLISYNLTLNPLLANW